MRIKLVTIFLAFIGVTSFAQITVYEQDVFSVGDVIYQAHDTSPGSVITIGSAGLNQIWDFSSLQESSSNTLFFISPIGTNYENKYPDANLCMDDNGSLSYYDKTSSGIFIHGVGDTAFNSPALFYPLPLTYGLTAFDGPIVIIDTAISGSFLSVVIPPATVVALSSGLANRADTALIQINSTTDFEVDGSGTITTPLGTYDALRLKMIQNTSSVLNVYCSDTLSGIGTWVNNIPFSSVPILAGFSNDEQEIKYQWITNDASAKFLLAEIVVDDLDNIINGVSFQTTSSASSISESKQDIFSVYPNPTSDKLIVNTMLNNCSYNLLDISGREIISCNFNNSAVIDLTGYSVGTYFLRISNNDNVITKKIVLE